MIHTIEPTLQAEEEQPRLSGILIPSAFLKQDGFQGWSSVY